MSEWILIAWIPLKMLKLYFNTLRYVECNINVLNHFSVLNYNLCLSWSIMPEFNIGSIIRLIILWYGRLLLFKHFNSDEDVVWKSNLNPHLMKNFVVGLLIWRSDLLKWCALLAKVDGTLMTFYNLEFLKIEL